MQKFLSKKRITLLVTLVAIVLLAWWIGPHHELMRSWISQAGWWGPLLAICLFVILSLTPIPSDPLSIIGVVLYGPWIGFLISWMGNNAAAVAEYIVAKNVESALKVDYHKLPYILRKFPVNSVWFLIGVRFVPALGGKMVAIMAGMYKVSWYRFLWTTMVANLVGAFIWSIGGLGFLNLFK